MEIEKQYRSFKPLELIKSFPDTAESLLLDQYLTDDEASSCRVFRVYRGTPAHYHAHSDEYLYVLTGRGTFWMADPANVAEFSPGDLLHFKKNIIHALPERLEEPIAFLAIDVPRRRPDDIIFVDPQQGSPNDFIQPAKPSTR